ncbi:hypothetical protein B0H13DRAFT_1851127 [Mycena leptocephala]|nr:hypothetical protein B0H13DRAFT_1851127 [Mycena leptocephala]
MFAPKQIWFMDLSLLFSHLSRLGESLDPQEPKDRKPQPRDKGAADHCLPPYISSIFRTHKKDYPGQLKLLNDLDPGSGARGCEEVRDCTGLREIKAGAQKTEVPARQSNMEKRTSHPQVGGRIHASPEDVDDWWGQPADSELPNPCEMEER